MRDKNTIESEIERLFEERSIIDAEINRLRVALAEQTAHETQTSTLLEAEYPQVITTRQQVMEPSLIHEYDAVPTVTKASNIQEKFDLFISLFSGRPDVHAKRFQSVGIKPLCK